MHSDWVERCPAFEIFCVVSTHIRDETGMALRLWAQHRLESILEFPM
jgi:hypothetical protein